MPTYVIRYRSIIGMPMWVVAIDNTPDESGEGFGPSVRSAGKEKYAKRYDPMEAEAALAIIRAIHPSAQIVDVSP